MTVLKRFSNSVSTISNPANWLLDWIGGSKTAAGVRIDGQTALTISTVWQAVKVISGDVGQLPLHRYQKQTEDKRARVKDDVLEVRPNMTMTPLKFKETLQAHSLVYGNGYGMIIRANDGTPMEITIIDPRKVSVFFNDTQQLRYKVVIERNGQRTERDYSPRDILHIRGLGYDGLTGYSVVSMAADSFGMAKAAEKHGASYFKNFATPQGLLKMPGSRPKQETVEQTREDWKTLHAGENEGDIAILYGGMEFTPLAFTNKDSQFLESREFQRAEIASWFNLPPHKVGDLSRATFTNIEEQNRDYLTTSLMYWLVNWQEECTDKLLTDKQKRQGYYYEFNTAALLRGDTQSRFEAYNMGINGGWLSRNEARRMENMDAVDGLDEYLVPLNMAAAGSERETQSDTSTSETADIITAAVVGIIRNEGNRILKTSETAKNFNDAVDKFYDHFPDKLWEVIEPMGATAETLDTYIEESKKIWSKLTETCTQGELCEAVGDLNQEWSSRANYLVSLILKDRNNG
jgi:HK97 family phage portal protein